MVSFTGCGKKELVDGSYKVSITMEGGTGKAYIESPADLTIAKQSMTVRLVWSSKNYDYMIVDGIKYLNEAKEGEASTFTIPLSSIEKPLTVIADTTAMSQPHEIEYTLTFELEE